MKHRNRLADKIGELLNRKDDETHANAFLGLVNEYGTNPSILRAQLVHPRGELRIDRSRVHPMSQKEAIACCVAYIDASYANCEIYLSGFPNQGISVKIDDGGWGNEATVEVNLEVRNDFEQDGVRYRFFKPTVKLSWSSTGRSLSAASNVLRNYQRCIQLGQELEQFLVESDILEAREIKKEG